MIVKYRLIYRNCLLDAEKKEPDNYSLYTDYYVIKVIILSLQHFKYEQDKKQSFGCCSFTPFWQTPEPRTATQARDYQTIDFLLGIFSPEAMKACDPALSPLEKWDLFNKINEVKKRFVDQVNQFFENGVIVPGSDLSALCEAIALETFWNFSFALVISHGWSDYIAETPATDVSSPTAEASPGYSRHRGFYT